MELKKNPKADLNRKRGVYMMLGLALTLFLVWQTFERPFYASSDMNLGELNMELEEEIVPVTRQEEVKPPPPAPPQVVEVLNIVEDNVEIEDELEVEDAEVDENTEVEIVEIEEEEEVDEVLPFAVIEDKPTFPGGDAALMKYLSTETQYPVIARENGIEGKVFVEFVIEKDGSVSDVKVKRGVDQSLDKEAERFVKAMPRWSPGKQRGKPVKVQYLVPINFKLS